MPDCTDLTTTRIRVVFAEAVASRQGAITDTFDDGERLFARSVLPHIEALRPGDRIQGGVALRANREEAWLHPYLFRFICRNGAILPRTIGTLHVADLHIQEPEETVRLLRKAIDSCCTAETFTESVHHMRTACEAEADLALSIMPLLSRLPAQMGTSFLSEIMEQFFRNSDRSRFGMINAITSVARDTPEPELRWDLEEYGGGIAVGKIPTSPRDQGALAKKQFSNELSLVDA
jgi:hypothetical protein